MPMTFTILTGAKTVAGSLQNFVNYQKVPAAVVLEDAQSLIYSQLRVREMRVSAEANLALGASYLALPDRFLEPIVLRDRKGISLIPNRGTVETFVSEAELMERRAYDDSDVIFAGIPCYVAIFDERYQFDVKASEARNYDHVFYQRPALLSEDNTTNFLTSRYPLMLRAACQAGAANFMKDAAEFQAREAELLLLINAANAESDLSRAS